MKRAALVLVLSIVACATSPARAVVFINKVFANPAGSFDSTQEFVELLGVPGMKLDGYAIAVLNGVQTKYYPLGSIPPVPTLVSQECDEFFSLDGLTLGANGILLIGIGQNFDYETLLPDSNFANWLSIWNGVNDVNPPNTMDNDGGLTILLIRNRPGQTQADPFNPDGLRWAKDAMPDGELTTPVIDPTTSQPVDQLGDGNIDRGNPDGYGGFTIDMKGALTLSDADDLEVVDEVSYQSDRGWRYDLDNRRVDAGSSSVSLPDRKVHTLYDPQGFNPDCLVRVDYRTKGPGWPTSQPGVGQLPNGNNWQDTATEQWIRGDSVVGGIGPGGSPLWFFENAANANPNALQPYRTQVPLWLHDGVAPDYSFSLQSYSIAPGRINQFATPFVPGDTNRDGHCDTEDIAKLSAVFGDDNWIFSNSYTEATYGDHGDPATQTRPWDVDATGDNGIEPTDLQWALNFQGSTNGQIFGVAYDSTTPSASGVHLNSNGGVACVVTAVASTPCGRPLGALAIGDRVDITVSARVMTGANLTTGQENGVMQFVHDVAIGTAGVARVESVQSLGTFSNTRAAIQVPQGVNGSLGMNSVNGYTTSFTQGLSAAAPIYRITLRTIGAGSAGVTILPASIAKFAASTPRGLKIGHTAQTGNPASTTYPAPITLGVTSARLGDINADASVNALDAGFLAGVLTGADTTPSRVSASDLNCDGARNGLDVQAFVNLLLGP